MRTLRGWAGCVAILLCGVADTRRLPPPMPSSTAATPWRSSCWPGWHAGGRTGSQSWSAIVGAWRAASSSGSRSPPCSPRVVESSFLFKARRNISKLLWVAYGTAVWVASFGVEYLVSLRQLHSSDTLLAFWAYVLAPKTGSKTRWLYHASDSVLGMIRWASSSCRWPAFCGSWRGRACAPPPPRRGSFASCSWL